MTGVDPASFRDPEARVFVENDRVFRGLNETALATYQAAVESGLIEDLLSQGLMIDHQIVDGVDTPTGVPDSAVIEARKIPFVTYPFEWSFEMLKDAAILTLDVTLTALEAGFQLKDASAFNVAFDGSTPVFIDVTSLDSGFDGAWVGYSQFCDHFLAPLLLEAYLGVPHQRYSKGSLMGLPITDLAKMLGWRRWYRRGVLAHVLLRARIERSSQGMSTDQRTNLRRGIALPVETVASNLRRMKRLVASLQSTATSTWATYMSSAPYDEHEATLKADFIRDAAAERKSRQTAWDVGGNNGAYARILEGDFETVVVLDSDPGAIDAGYAGARKAGSKLNFGVVDITDPTPDRGWLGLERKALVKRSQPDFAVWLALVHHLCIAGEVPLGQFVRLLSSTSREHVVEFVDAADPMARRLMSTRKQPPRGYGKDEFEGLVATLFGVRRAMSVSPTRHLYHLVAHERSS
jgi:hypothetical protein